MALIEKEESFWDKLAGTVNDRVTPVFQTNYGDEGDQAKYAAMVKSRADELASLEEWAHRMTQTPEGWSKGFIWGQAATPEAKAKMARLESLRANPVDISAIQAQSDRDRLLKEGLNTYKPLIGMLMTAARGEGPSAAVNYYKQMSDDAARRNYGLAASARGTGGQRAALFQAAMGQEAIDRQKAANQGAQIGAEEQQRARQGLIAAAAGLTNVYGNYLYGGTKEQLAANQHAQQLADQA